MKPPLRTKSVGTKVSEEEFAALESRARARKLTLSEWVRAELLEPRDDGGAAADEVLLGEVLALRTILMNLMFSLTNGKPVTPEAMRELIERADGDKERRAMERLTAARATGPEPKAEPEAASQTVAEITSESSSIEIRPASLARFEFVRKPYIRRSVRHEHSWIGLRIHALEIQNYSEFTVRGREGHIGLLLRLRVLHSA